MGADQSVMSIPKLKSAPFPVTLTDPKFVLYHQVNLRLMKQWHMDTFDIRDNEGTLFSHKTTIYDVDGNAVANVRHVVGSIPPQYETAAGDGAGKVIMNSKATFKFGTKDVNHKFVDAFSGENIKLRSVMQPFNFDGEVHLTGSDGSSIAVVAKFQKQGLGRRECTLAVAPGVDMVLICLICIMLEYM
ncbi:hypothetical protein HK105_204978 [Polyrhizophydium stewartii]|uniref:Tubby C-terminal-like domain-containing protein n=1 Tax=Polyrhizophydium stewartii TaxID=2732419 RepID=A0ABR4N749_9FUNG